MALPPIDMGADDLEADEGFDEGMDDEGALDEGEGSATDLDPMFAVDAAEAFPDMDDAQLAALQRCILGLISGGGAPPAPPASPAPMGGF